MDLKQLNALRAIAETGSFHAAAERLGLTQPAISRQIGRLEEELGDTLVLRSRPRVALSPAGELVVDAAARIFGELDALRDRLNPSDNSQAVGVLRVAATSLGIVYLYSDILEAFIARHPQVEPIVTVTETHLDGARLVLSRKADVAFAAFPLDLGGPEQDALEQIDLGEAENVIIAARTHKLAKRKNVTAADLMAFPFVRYQTGSGSRHLSDRYFMSREGYPPILLESNDTEFIKRMVGLGLGVAMVPAFTVGSGRLDRRLCRLGLTGERLTQSFGLVTRRGARSRAVSLFLDFCAQRRFGQLAA
jgi:DNA-binding transcriptional LysR family regulator